MIKVPSEFRNIPHSLRHRVRAMRVSQSGVIAVEFSLLAPIIIVMMMSALVLAYIYLAKTELSRIAQDIGRQVMLGNVTGVSSNTFQSAACSDIAVILNCSNLAFNIQHFAVATSSGSCVTAPSETAGISYDANGNVVNFQNFSVGDHGTINIIQLSYPLPVFGSRFMNFGDLSNGSLLISSTVAVYYQ